MFALGHAGFEWIEGQEYRCKCRRDGFRRRHRRSCCQRPFGQRQDEHPSLPVTPRIPTVRIAPEGKESLRLAPSADLHPHNRKLETRGPWPRPPCMFSTAPHYSFDLCILTFDLTPHLPLLSSSPDGKRARRPSAPDISTAARPSPAKLDDSVAARNSDLRS